MFCIENYKETHRVTRQQDFVSPWLAYATGSATSCARGAIGSCLLLEKNWRVVEYFCQVSLEQEWVELRKIPRARCVRQRQKLILNSDDTKSG